MSAGIVDLNGREIMAGVKSRVLTCQQLSLTKGGHHTSLSSSPTTAATMDAEISRILHAVHVASSPLNQDKSLQVEAVNYLAEVQQNAYQDQVWALALTLFVDTSTDPLKRKYDPQTRLFALRILDEFLDNR